MAFGEAPEGEGSGGEPLSIDALEEEITTLAAHLSAATYRLLVLIEEFDRRQGWAGWGLRSCAHWLCWKCGIGLVAAREKVRVARALSSLPRVSAAMREGRLSYSKVRALTRIAGAHNESALLSIADNGTASHVERVVRLYRRTAPDRERQRVEEREAAVAQFEERGLSYFWDHDGCLVVQGRLPPEQGALVVKALAAADEALRASQLNGNAPGSNRERERTSARSAVGGARLRGPERASETAREPAPERGRATGGEGPREQNDSAESFESVVREDRSWRCRQGDAFALMAETLLARGSAELNGLPPGERHLVHVHVDLSVLSDGDSDNNNNNGAGRCHVADGPALSRDVARRLACDGGVVAIFEGRGGEALDVGRKTRAVPPAMRRALESRDGGCRFPGCTCTRFVDAHHIELWAKGGHTRVDNLVLLCRFHHRLVHEGGFSIGRRQERIVFLRPDGREVPAVPAVRAPRDAGARTIQRKHHEVGLSIDARTAVPGFGGERADYTYMLTMLEQRDLRRSG